MKGKDERITKEDLKKDTFAEKVAMVEGFVEENWKMVSYIAVGIVLVVIVGILMIRSKKKASKEASGKLGIAEMTLMRGDTADAVVRLENLTEKYTDTQSAKLGLALLGNIKLKQNEFDQARQYFNKYIRNYDEKDLVTAQIYRGLAEVEVEFGNYSQAAKNYEKAADKAQHNFQKNEALVNAIRYYLENSNINKAENLLAKVKNNSPGEELENKISSLESLINVKKG